MSPVRRTYVTINWILIALFIVSLVTLIVAITRHDKKLQKRALIATIVFLILVVVALTIEIQSNFWES